RVARQPAPGAAAPAPCYDSPYCKEHIPGSAWDFGIKSDEEIERNKGALKKDPALRKKLGVMRVAVEVKKFLLANAPELLNGLADVLVNPAIMTAVGAQMGKCALPRPATPQGRPAQCVEVPLKMEDEAALFNKGEEPRPGEMDRDAWSARIRRIFTHEVAHLTFDINKPPGISATDEVSLWELSELSAILSEFRIWVGEEVRRARGAKTKEVAAEEWGDKYIEKKGEGVRGILMKIRCTVPCEVANASIKATFETRTAGWPQEDADLLLRVLTNPSRFLDWPMPPPPRTIKPPTPDVERPLPDRPKQGPLYAPRGGFDFNEP
ncbi:MAG TPA: hypothetical protein VN282_24220, partial [Pyrinomonadaceae bacterium]|nr:hypothetical protein [Pyrinomonadaceae bacterium]